MAERPRKTPLRTVATDFGHHVVYGVALAGAYRALDAVVDR